MWRGTEKTGQKSEGLSGETGRSRPAAWAGWVREAGSSPTPVTKLVRASERRRCLSIDWYLHEGGSHPAAQWGNRIIWFLPDRTFPFLGEPVEVVSPLQIGKDSHALAAAPSLSPIGFCLSVHDGWVGARSGGWGKETEKGMTNAMLASEEAVVF